MENVIKKSILTTLCIIIICMQNGCKTVSPSSEQNITGQVLWLEGNYMPGPGKSPPAGQPVKRKILIYEATTRTQVKGSPPLYEEINSNLVSRFYTDDEGNFKVSLPVGIYSIFTEEEDGYFASTVDDRGYISPVEIKRDEAVPLTIKINYKAHY